MQHSFERLKETQINKNTRLCIGIDPIIERLPFHLQSIGGLRQFCNELFDATNDLCCCYKINFAFFECLGIDGMRILKDLINRISLNVPVIADAKRGDIGNSSKYYAEAVFNYFKADAVTVNPYMGYDSVLPFLEYEGKLVFLLSLTSNPGSSDFQRLLVEGGSHLFERVISLSKNWGTTNTLGYVVGATHLEELKKICSLVDSSMLLIPGIGTQGGNLEKVMDAIKGKNAIINVSRDIIFTSQDENYLEKVREKAQFYKEQINLN